MNLRRLALVPTKQFRTGRTVLDCSGSIRGAWIERAVREEHLKVLVYRRDFRGEDVERVPRLEGVQMVSGDLKEVLDRTRESVSLLIDDLGSFHFSEQPLELLKRYYDALAWDGEAWIRFPKSFWVFLEDQHRVSLQDYLVSKFPSLAKRIRPGELDPAFAATASSAEDWVLLKKDRGFPKIFFHLQPRTAGGTSVPEGSAHAPYLEFVERKATPGAAALKRAA